MVVHTKEVINIMSEIAKERFKNKKNHPWYGRHHTEESKRKMSKSHKGKKLSEEHKIKIGLASKRMWSDSKLKKRASEKMIGKNNPMYGVHRYGRDNPMFGVHRYGKNNPFWGRRQTKEVKRNMSKLRKGKSWEEIYGKEKADKVKKKLGISTRGKNNPNYGKHAHYPKHYFVKALGHGVRSSWEEEVGLLLKNNGIPYGYETRRFDLGNVTYTPDFEINLTTFIEVKGYLNSINKKKLLKFKRLYPDMTLIGVGDGNEKVFDIHIKWKDKEKLIYILKNN